MIKVLITGNVKNITKSKENGETILTVTAKNQGYNTSDFDITLSNTVTCYVSKNINSGDVVSIDATMDIVSYTCKKCKQEHLKIIGYYIEKVSTNR